MKRQSQKMGACRLKKFAEIYNKHETKLPKIPYSFFSIIKMCQNRWIKQNPISIKVIKESTRKNQKENYFFS